MAAQAERPRAPRWDAMVVVGRVARSHGRRGEVVVNVETDFPEQRFRAGGVVYTRGGERPEPRRIAGVRYHAGRPIVAFDGVATIDAAAALANQELRVPSADQQALPRGSYYADALIGCRVRTLDGRVVGTVSDVQGPAAASRLIVQPQDRQGEVDVPLVAPICVHIDTAQRIIVVDPPPGLLELNRRSTEP